MTTDHWLQMAAISSNLVVPAAQWFVQSRKKQPTAAPEENQPKNLTQRIKGRFIKFSLSVWQFPSVIVVFNLANLISSLRSSANPPSRSDVLSICLAMMGIWWGFALMGANLLWKAINLVTDGNTKILQLVEEFIREFSDYVRDCKRLIENPQCNQPEAEPKQGFSKKLRTALKTLLED